MKGYNLIEFPQVTRFAVGFDRVFDELNRTAAALNGTNYPPYNIVRVSDTSYDIEIAVAGFAENELDIELQSNELVVRGESANHQSRSGEYIHHGIANRNFVRSFALADNVEVEAANVKNGILTVNLKVVIPEHEKAKKIAITFQK